MDAKHAGFLQSALLLSACLRQDRNDNFRLLFSSFRCPFMGIIHAWRWEVSVFEAKALQGMFYVQLEGVCYVKLMTEDEAFGFQKFLADKEQVEDVEQMKEAFEKMAEENPDAMTLDVAIDKFNQCWKSISGKAHRPL